MPEPITRSILERFDVPEGNYETVIMLVEIAPQVNSGLHTHPGFDAAYLLEGGLTVLEQGQPDKLIRAGQSWHVRPSIVHEVKAGTKVQRYSPSTSWKRTNRWRPPRRHNQIEVS